MRRACRADRNGTRRVRDNSALTSIGANMFSTGHAQRTPVNPARYVWRRFVLKCGRAAAHSGARRAAVIVACGDFRRQFGSCSGRLVALMGDARDQPGVRPMQTVRSDVMMELMSASAGALLFVREFSVNACEAIRDGGRDHGTAQWDVDARHLQAGGRAHRRGSRATAQRAVIVLVVEQIRQRPWVGDERAAGIERRQLISISPTGPLHSSDVRAIARPAAIVDDRAMTTAPAGRDRREATTARVHVCSTANRDGGSTRGRSGPRRTTCDSTTCASGQHAGLAICNETYDHSAQRSCVCARINLQTARSER